MTTGRGPGSAVPRPTGPLVTSALLYDRPSERGPRTVTDPGPTPVVLPRCDTRDSRALATAATQTAHQRG